MYNCFNTLLIIIISAAGLYGQVNFKLDLLEDLETYQFSLIPEKTWQAPYNNLTSTAQVTIKVPTNSFKVKEVKSLIATITWDTHTVTSPTEAPEYDYITFDLASLGTKAIIYEAGVTVPLFTFKNSEGCQGSVELMAAEDPFTAPNSMRANVGNSITVFGARGEAYKGNSTNQAISCPTKVKQFEVVAFSNLIVQTTFDLTLDAITEGQLEYALINHEGKLIYEEFQYLYPGLNEIQLSLKDLPEGVYKVKLKLDNEEEFLVIQKASDEQRSNVPSNQKIKKRN